MTSNPGADYPNDASTRARNDPVQRTADMRTGSTSLGRRALRRLLAAVLAVLTGVIGAVALYYLSVLSTVRNVTAQYPPTFLSDGDADPFRSQAAELVSALKSHAVPLTTLLWTGTGDGLGHEYELNFNLPEARTAFQQTLVFLAAHTKG